MWNELQKSIYTALSGMSGCSGVYFGKTQSTTAYPYAVFYLNEERTGRFYGGLNSDMTLQINFFDKNQNSSGASSVREQITGKLDDVYLSGSGVSTTRLKRDYSTLLYDELNKNWQLTMIYSFVAHK